MIINTTSAPEAIGPYSQAIKIENHIYISGCCPFNTHDGSVMGNDIETQTLKAMNNLKAIIEAAGASMDDIVKTTCFIKDIKDFPILIIFILLFYIRKIPSSFMCGSFSST